MPDKDTASKPDGGHICPAGRARFLVNPLRRLIHRPGVILEPFVRAGDTVADIGCGPGFFTLPLARLVGHGGRVLAVDRQEGMLAVLKRRAIRAGLDERILAHRCPAGIIGYPGPCDFVLAFYMVHEVPSIPGFLREVRAMLRPGGKLLVAEPWGHVGQEEFDHTVAVAEKTGFERVIAPRIALSRTVLLRNPR